MSDLTFRELQEQQAVWAARNFGDTPPHRPLLGALEELGELAHAHLKDEQGIRGTSEHHTAKKKDAIGDIIVYLADYCTRQGFSLQEAIELTWSEVSQRDWVANPQTGGIAS